MDKWFYWLVVSTPSEKYARQLGLLFPIYGKMKFMFQTTKQSYHDTSFIVTTGPQADSMPVQTLRIRRDDASCPYGGFLK